MTTYLEYFDSRQLKLWRQRIFEVYDRFRDVFEEYGLDEELRNLLNNLDYLLSILSTKLPYQLKIAKVNEFLEDLDRFRVYASRYLGGIADLLYRDVREVIKKVFNVEVLRMKSRVVAVFIDTSRTASRTAEGKRKKRKPHVVFDGERVFEVNKLTKLKDVDEVFIDTLFPEIYEEVLGLLKRGIKVYLLRNTTVLKKLGLENNLQKSDEVDALILSRVPRECFRELTIEEVELKATVRPLISKYEWIVEKRKMLKQWKSRGFDYNFRESINLMENDRREIGREIMKIVDNSIYKDIYRMVCNELQMKNSTEIAILTVELPLRLPLNTLKRFVGLTPNHNNHRYNHRIRNHLSLLATNIYINAKRWKNKWEVPEEFREIVDSLP